MFNGKDLYIKKHGEAGSDESWFPANIPLLWSPLPLLTPPLCFQTVSLDPNVPAPVDHPSN